MPWTINVILFINASQSNLDAYPLQHQIQHEAGNLDYGWLVDDDIKEMAVVIHNEIPFVIEGLGEVYEQRRQLFMTSSAGTGLQSERVLAEVVHT